jgi:putative YpdA family bacillithiol system oxidoreductase
MSDSLITFIITAILIGVTLIPYLLHRQRKEAAARKKFHEMKISGLQEATTMHPHINVTTCIGCGGCVNACPEGDVLGIIDGKAALIHGAKCVGHGLCADACPVGAIELLMAKPSRGADFPLLSDELETSVKGIYIAGELGGIGLIKNAAAQGKAVVDHLATHLPLHSLEYDVAVIGAGPAGMAAGLAAKEKQLRYIILEQGEIGGAILHYPRAKVVMTAPIELPLYGKLKLRDIEKEELVKTWQNIVVTTGLDVCTNEKVQAIAAVPNGFSITTPARTISTAKIVLALGRRGTPRKLGVPGEEQAKVMYRLIDASSYTNTRVLVVGGGDSAIEAAIGLSLQPGNIVTLSYRKGEFSRIKERNSIYLKEQLSRKKIQVVFNSEVAEIKTDSVILTTETGTSEIANDYVFVFAGGELPFELLKSIGISMLHRQM